MNKVWKPGVFTVVLGLALLVLGAGPLFAQEQDQPSPVVPSSTMTQVQCAAMMQGMWGMMGGNPMSSMMGGGPMSDMTGGNPMYGTMGHGPMSGMMGSGTISGTMGGGPMSDMTGGNPMSGTMGHGPMSGMMGGQTGTPMQDMMSRMTGR